VTDSFAGMLIRADERIAYMIQDGIPIMLIEKALMLDPSVGPPNPEKYRKKYWEKHRRGE